jgi:DNA-directed RNA polymerase specialized sigma24 family protein
MSLPLPQPDSSWQVSQQPVALGPRPLRGKNFRHELLVEMSVRGTRSAGTKWMKLVGCELERTLKCLLGPDAPLEPLLESARFQALSAWPPPVDQPLSVWVQRIAGGVALGHLKGQPAAPGEGTTHPARPGGIREVLSNLYARLRAMPPQEQLAFALLELNGSSVSEAATVLRVSPTAIRRWAARVRRQLLFAARRDRLLLRYLCIALRLQGLSRRLDRAPAPIAAE